MRDLILKYYTQPTDDRALSEGALKGMLQSLGDPYSSYMTEEQYQQFVTSLAGEYGGIGVAIESVDSMITVMSVFPDTPAERAGIKTGDIILEANGVSLKGKTATEAALILRGDPGTVVVLTVLRESTGETLWFNISRQIITPPNLEFKDLGEGLYYIKIQDFTESAARNFTVLANYVRNAGGKGIVLDLRDNPGGLLDACFSIAEDLIPKGPIVQIRGKDFAQTVESASDLSPVPVVVLTSKGTASASEILAAAIRDRGVGILVGETTFGKGRIQSIFSLGGGLGAVRLTVAEYFSPAGNPINGVGLKPDIEVSRDPKPVPPKPQLKRTLSRGIVGLDVLSLQELLNLAGYDVGEADGIFGPKTESGVLAFCRDHGIAYAGQVTQHLLDLIYNAAVQKTQEAGDPILQAGINALKTKIATGSWPTS